MRVTKMSRISCTIFASRSKKSQAAMEFLMTYGWSILIIAVVLGALFQLGVFSSANLAPRAQTGNCRVLQDLRHGQPRGHLQRRAAAGSGAVQRAGQLCRCREWRELECRQCDYSQCVD